MGPMRGNGCVTIRGCGSLDQTGVRLNRTRVATLGFSEAAVRFFFGHANVAPNWVMPRGCATPSGPHSRAIGSSFSSRREAVHADPA